VWGAEVGAPKRKDHITAGNGSFERLCATGLDRDKTVIQHRAEDFAELSITIGVLPQLCLGGRRPPGQILIL
jgi:hypothetical protein